LFWIFSTFTLGYCIWITRRSERGPHKRCIERIKKLLRRLGKSIFASTGDVEEVTEKTTRLNMINIEPRSHSKWET
jgi:hypothetical protein